MVEIIGLVTMGALVWVLAWSLAGESDAERRKISSVRSSSRSGPVVENEMPEKQAA